LGTERQGEASTHPSTQRLDTRRTRRHDPRSRSSNGPGRRHRLSPAGQSDMGRIGLRDASLMSLLSHDVKRRRLRPPNHCSRPNRGIEIVLVWRAVGPTVERNQGSGCGSGALLFQRVLPSMLRRPIPAFWSHREQRNGPGKYPGDEMRPAFSVPVMPKRSWLALSHR
jgi:hypothetical protein